MTNRRFLFWLVVILVALVFIYSIRTVLLPFVLGVMTAYFLDPAADRLQKNGMSRNLATSLITVGFFLVISALALLMIPVLWQQLSGLVASIPEYLARLEHDYGPQLSRWLGGLPSVEMGGAKEAVANVSGGMVTLLGDFITGLFASGMAFINLLSLALITPIVTFYLLRDWDQVTARVDTLLPRRHAPVIREQLAIIDDTLAGFIRGQLNVCLILATYYALALSLAGLNFGIIIGILTGLLVILPYVGFLAGFLLGMGVALFQFDGMAPVLVVFGVFMLGQAVESYFLTPKLVGEQVGLHPVWVIFGMLAGAALFGFVGVLLAIPATAVIGVLIRFSLGEYMKSDYYQERQTPPLIAPEP